MIYNTHAQGDCCLGDWLPLRMNERFPGCLKTRLTAGIASAGLGTENESSQTLTNGGWCENDQREKQSRAGVRECWQSHPASLAAPHVHRCIPQHRSCRQIHPKVFHLPTEVNPTLRNAQRSEAASGSVMSWHTEESDGLGEQCAFRSYRTFSVMWWYGMKKKSVCALLTSLHGCEKRRCCISSCCLHNYGVTIFCLITYQTVACVQVTEMDPKTYVILLLDSELRGLVVGYLRLQWSFCLPVTARRSTADTNWKKRFST